MSQRLAPLAALVLLSACAVAPDSSDLAPVDVATYPIVDGSPAAVGLLDLLNDPATTLQVLDHEVPLNRRAAENLMARKAHGSFDSVADVDDVYWVGASAIDAMVAYADAQGLVPSGGDVLGSWDGVEFTVEQADLMREIVVNDLDHYDFDPYIGLDRRAADSIVAAQPVPSVAVLAGLYYVGNSALTKLKAETEEMMGDEWPECVPQFTPLANPAADDFNVLLAETTTVDQPWADIVSLQASGCQEWWTQPGAVDEALWNATFFIDWSELPEDYRIVSPWTPGGGSFVGTLQTALPVIDERVLDGDFVPAEADAATQALYEDRFDIVDALSGDLATQAGAYVQKTLYMDMSECSEEAAILVDTRDGSVLIAHESPGC